MYFPIGQIYIYQRVSDMKGFPYRNVSQGGEGSGCADEGLGKNSSLWQLEKEVSNAKLCPNGLCRSYFGADAPPSISVRFGLLLFPSLIVFC